MPGAYRATLSGSSREFCCAGCQAIAQTIHGEGLEAFYARRVPLGDKPEAVDEMFEVLRAYDDPALVDRFTRRLEGSVREITLQLEKIRCAACMWLNEQHLRRLPGVLEVEVNYVTRRGRVRFAEGTRLSSILQAVRAIGYEAWPYEASGAREAAKRARQSLLMRLGVALLGMMQVMMYAWPAYTEAPDLLREQAALLGWASFALTLPVMLYSAAPIFVAAWASVRHFSASRTLGMDVPVALALLLGFAAGSVNLVAGDGATYFDSITMFVALLLAARYIELAARTDAQSGAEALARQLPATCERLVNFPRCMTSEIVPVVKLGAGEVVRVAPGDVLPCDGVVVDGASAVDEALLTGEARPVAKDSGDRVFAGSFNQASPLVIEVEAVGANTRIAGIAAALDRALGEKPHLAANAEKWASTFVLGLLLVAIATALAWSFIGSQDAWVHAVAVLVVSCPCALSLATPAALAAAQGAMTRRGVLMMRGHALETLAAASHLVLDKTGTLTTGELRLERIDTLRELAEDEALAIAAGLEVGQKHPVAMALLRAARDRGIAPRHFSQTPQGLTGKGVSAQGWALGSARWTGGAAIDASGASVVQLGFEGDIVARFVLVDQARAGAADLVRAARAAGLKVQVLSGDGAASVESWARALGVDDWRAECSPEEKLATIKALQARGAIVWAVGDGVNDAPQLAQANVSVAIGSGAPLAQAGADCALTTASLLPLAEMLGHAKKTRRVIRQNLAWAFAYNLVAIPAAALGWVGPWGAAIGMSISSLLVTLNAWRLRRVSRRNAG